MLHLRTQQSAPREDAGPSEHRLRPELNAGTVLAQRVSLPELHTHTHTEHVLEDVHTRTRQMFMSCDHLEHFNCSSTKEKAVAVGTHADARPTCVLIHPTFVPVIVSALLLFFLLSLSDM